MTPLHLLPSNATPLEQALSLASVARREAEVPLILQTTAA